MARQAIPVEALETYIRDLEESVATLKEVAQAMKAHNVASVFGHAIRVDTDSIPRIFKFADDLRSQFRIARRAAETGKPDPTVSTIERAKKEMKRRQAKKVEPKSQRNGKAK